MSRHGNTDDGAQNKGKFSTMDSPLNITVEGGDAPKGDNLVPTSPSPDPLGYLSPLGKAKDIGPGRQ
jgi:hypothetical protein